MPQSTLTFPSATSDVSVRSPVSWGHPCSLRILSRVLHHPGESSFVSTSTFPHLTEPSRSCHDVHLRPTAPFELCSAICVSPIQTEPLLRLCLSPRALLPYSLPSRMSLFSRSFPEDIRKYIVRTPSCILLCNTEPFSVSLSLSTPPFCHHRAH